MSARMHWPKDRICAGDIDRSIKSRSSQYALVLHDTQHSRQLVSHYCELLSALYTECCQSNSRFLLAAAMFEQ